MTTTKNLKDLLTGCQLPALPQSAIRLLELSQDPKNGIIEFAQPLEADPGLAGQVLKFVNSSYFGFSREISSLKMAISLVGIGTIKNFAMWNAVFSMMPNPKCGPFDLKDMWVDSLRRGLFARGIGKLMNLKESEDLFTAALLQDLAIPLLAKEFPEAYTQIIQTREITRERLSALERAKFGWDHAEAGGAIARMWNMPEPLALALENHVKLAELCADPQANRGHIAVALSALLPAANDPEWIDLDTLTGKFQKLTGIKGKSGLCDLLAQVDSEYTEIAPILHLPVPERTLIAFYNSHMNEAVSV